jgi:serine/threonine protein kinase
MEESFSLNSNKFINPTLISDTVFSKVRKFDAVSQPNQHFTIKTIYYDDEEIKKELNTWEKLQNLSKKPKSLPKFLGHYQDPFLLGNHLNLVFEFVPITFRMIIDSKESFSFPQLYLYFKSLLNVSCFLQTMDICHRILTPSTLFLDQNNQQIYVLDLADSKESLIKASKQEKNDLIISDSIQYLSPELHDIFWNYQKGNNQPQVNQYKADVFSLALIILELGNGELPVKEFNDLAKWKKNIDNSLQNLHKKCEAKLERPEEKESLGEFMDILKKCLSFNPEARFDFRSLFLYLLVIDDETMRNFIILDEEKRNRQNQPMEGKGHGGPGMGGMNK